MKLLNCAKQGIQPVTDSEARLVKFDVNYLRECLSLVEDRRYSIVQQPDVTERSRPRPDYLLEDKKGNRVAVEHARFFESQGKREHEAVEVKKGGKYIGPINFPTREELGERLSEFFDDKLSKEEFSGLGNCERILLARNRWGGISIERFLECEPYFKPLRRKDCDHFYLIVQGQLVEVF